MIIGTESFGRTAAKPIDELTPWERSVVRSMDRIPQAVAHEAIHHQQRFPAGATTLLERSIAESGADFLSELSQVTTSMRCSIDAVINTRWYCGTNSEPG
jgi:hypothetical protein